MTKRSLLHCAIAAVVFAAGFYAGQQRGTAAAKNRVYELRTYYTNEGKLADLQKRFRDHTTRIFEKHKIKSVWYGVPQDAPAKNDTLIYLISHDSREAAKASWDAFRADPQWKKVAAASEVNGKIVKKV